MKMNRSSSGILILILLAATVVAQDQGGRFNGQVTGPFDGLVAAAPMRATHITSGDSWQTPFLTRSLNALP